VLTAVNAKMAVFWIVAPCSLVFICGLRDPGAVLSVRTVPS
jgi:hypothetical protein